MPQAVAAAIVGAIGLTGTAAIIVGAVIQLAVAWGLNALAQSLFGPETPKPSDVQRVVRQSVGSRVRHYGTVHTGGTLVFLESKDATLYSVIVTGQGEIDEILEHRLNNKVVSLDAAGVVQESQYDGKISLFSRKGTSSQTYFSELGSVFTEWTTNHRMRGCSAVMMICRPAGSEEFGDVYEGNREPTYTRVINSTRVYDPRLDSTQTGGSGSHRLDDESTWEFSSNAALVTADYLAHDDGYGLGYDAINWINIMGEADVCDQTVTTVDSRNIPRWRISGSYEMSSAQRRAVLGEMLRASDAFLWQDENGLANLLVGRWVEPTVSVSDDHIVSLTGSVGGDPQSSTNEVRVVYTDPRLSYTETECSPIVDEAAQTELGRAEIQRYDVFYCPDHNQASRLGKRHLARLSDRWNLTLVLNLYGLNLIGERFCKVSVFELGITDLDFEVVSLSLDLESGLVEVSLVQVSSSDFSFNASTEEGTPPTVAPDTEPDITVPVPTGLSVSVAQTTSGLGLSASWSENSARPDLTVDAQYRNTSNSSWLPMPVSQGERIAIASGINSGSTYGVRVRYVTVSGIAGDWSTEVTQSASESETSPSTPTNFSSSESTGTVTLSWRNPTESNFSYVDVYRHSSDDFTSASTVGGDQVGALGENMQYQESPGTGTWYYWLVARSASGLSSDETTSETQTVT